MKTFKEYILLKEGKESSGENVVAKNTTILGKDEGIEPFFVGSKYGRKNLGELVKAFNNSNEVEFGPSMIDVKAPKNAGQNTSGLTKNKLKKKTLYLVGGAVRDHLLGQTPNDYDLATDATMDEIRLILLHADFTEIAPQTATNGEEGEPNQKYANLPKKSSGSKKFYVQGTDINGQEFVMGAKVNGETFEIATFRKDSKGASDGRTTAMSFTPNLEEDAARRDFTVNAMYIPLTNENGPNNKLIDIYGGVRHLKSKKVRFVGNPKDRLQEDELRALRYARFASLFEDTDIPEDVIEAIAEMKGLQSLQPFDDPKTGRRRDRRKRIRDEFLKGLKKEKIDPKVYVGLYKKLGLLPTVFPGMKFREDGPDDVSDQKEKHLAVAWILKDNDANSVYDMLTNAHWTNDEAKRIAFLIKFLHFHPEIDPNNLNRMSSDFMRSGLSSGYLNGNEMGQKSLLSTWAQMNKSRFPEGSVEAFLKHVSHGPIKVSADDPMFADLFVIDPFSGIRHGTPGISQRQAELAHKRFLDILKSGQLKNV